jgi:type I restriction enzyme S subunit
MSFPRYLKYKASGVDWLGEVPEGWAVKRLRFVANLNPSKSEISDLHRGTAVSFLPMESVGDDGVLALDKEKSIAELETGYTYFREGDVTIAKITPCYENGKGALMLGLTNGIGFGTTELIVARPIASQITGTYLHYLFISPDFRCIGESHMYGAGGQKRVPDAFVRNFATAIPPLAEQTAIAAFLDHETAKIDELVAEQERLIELLKEKRQAVISHAVTKGLNPDAPMKDSGIEWLGKVPEHWDVLPLKRIVSAPITDGPHETPRFVEEGVPFVSAEAVSSGQIDFTKVRACITVEDNARYSKKYSPKLHDIYMVKSGATTGVTAMVEDRTDFNIWSPLAVIRCNSGSVPHFVLNFMRSRHFLEAVTLFWSFGTQQNIGMGVIENLACTVPSADEQLEITRYLDSELAKFGTLTTEANRVIDLLKERRTALISAAVTGQIDVRNLVPVGSA